MPETPRKPFRRPGTVSAVPTEALLHGAALAHLARYTTTQAGLVRVLDRRIDRWARSDPIQEPEQVACARACARHVAALLVKQGLVDDAAFAENRARSLTRAGRSRRAVSAHLAARGVVPPPPPDAQTELAAAVVFTRRRRIGPFRRLDSEADPHRELGALARAGFDRDVAVNALAMDLETAQNLIHTLRQD